MAIILYYNNIVIREVQRYDSKTSNSKRKKINYWADIIERAEIAEDIETGEVKAIRYNGYLSNDLSVRKAIAMTFGLPTFRK